MHFKAIIDNYEDIHWKGMRITKYELDTMLGVRKVGGVRKMPDWPLNDRKYQKFEQHVKTG